MAEAPCKAIVTGEHFVVHGGTALAVALGRKVRVEACEAERQSVSSSIPGGRERLRPVAAVIGHLASAHGFSPSVRVSIHSSIPDGSGLGSSASTMVAVTAALSALHSLDLTTEQIVEGAMVGERLIHGRPSGIDVNVCAYGGVILFRTGERPRTLSLPSSRTLIVVHSGRRRRTRAMIRQVSESREKNPSLFLGLSQAVTELSEMAAKRLVEGDMEGLGRLLTLNHALLSAVGASSGGLDRLVDLLLSLGCPGAKLTGAGGGGSVIAVPPTGKEKRVLSELLTGGFEAFKAEIPVGGVKSWLER